MVSQEYKTLGDGVITFAFPFADSDNTDTGYTPVGLTEFHWYPPYASTLTDICNYCFGYSVKHSLTTNYHYKLYLITLFYIGDIFYSWLISCVFTECIYKKNICLCNLIYFCIYLYTFNCNQLYKQSYILRRKLWLEKLLQVKK